MTDLSHSAHGRDDTRNELRRPLAIRIVCGLRLKQLGVGEDDAELIVQTVKERRKRVASLRFVSPWADDRRRHGHA